MPRCARTCSTHEERVVQAEAQLIGVVSGRIAVARFVDLGVRHTKQDALGRDGNGLVEQRLDDTLNVPPPKVKTE